MTRLPFWTSDEGAIGETYTDDPWHLLLIGGDPVPGLTEFTGLGAPRKRDIKDPAGKHGGTVTVHGRKPIEFESRTRIWREEQWTVFQVLVEWIYPQAGRGEGKAYDLAHPSTDYCGIKSATVVDVLPPQPGSNPDERVLVIKWAEYAPAHKRAPSATKSIDTSQVGTRPEFEPSVAANGNPYSTAPANYVEALPSQDRSFFGP